MNRSEAKVSSSVGTMNVRARFALIEGEHCPWLYDDLDGSLTPLEAGTEAIALVLDGAPYPSKPDDAALQAILEAAGRFAAAKVEPPDLRTRYHIANLKLALSTRCPAACDYCFKGEGLSPPAPLGIAPAALKAFVEDYGKACDLIVVAYNLTSEPLADLDALRELVVAREKVEAESGKTVNIYLCTSGTVRTKEAFELAERAIRGNRLAISVDGYREVHDRHRKDKAGRGTFDGVMEVVRWAQSRGIGLEAQAVLTRDYPQADAVVDALLDLGFSSINAKPVRPGSELAFTLADLPPLLESWDRLFERLDRDLARGKWDFFEAVKHDYWLKPLWKIALGLRSSRRCFWGTTHAVVDAKGDFYPCDVVIGDERARCGSLEAGMDWEKFHADLGVDKREPCASCWARHICGGACYAMGLMRSGDALAVDAVECAMSRHLSRRCLELAVRHLERANSLRSLGRRLLAY